MAKKTKAKTKLKKKVIKKSVKKVAKKAAAKKKIAKKTAKKVAPKKKVKTASSKKVAKGGKSAKNTKLTAMNRKALDLEQKSQEIIDKGKKRGFVTYDEIIKVFPDIENNILFLDELYEKLSVSGIDVLEGGNLLDMDGDSEKQALKYSKDAVAYDSIQIYLKEI